MQAVILAAGKSQRFYPFTSLPHKSLVSILGKSLLERTINSLKDSEVREVLIVVGENSPIPEILPQIPGMNVRFIVQKETLGMGHALLSASEYLEDSFFLLSAYHFECNKIIPEILKARTKDCDVVLSAKKDSISERYGVLQTNGIGVKAVVERPIETEGEKLRVIGIYLLSKEFVKTLSNLPVEHYHFEKALDEYAKKGRVAHVVTSAPTITLKYVWDLLAVKDLLLKDFKHYVSKNAFVSPHAILSGPVYISDGARILEGACIKGPCYIGENVIVGNNSILRNGVIIEKNVVVGATMEVKNSIIMQNTTTHTGFIGDSVIGENTKLAAGFLSANVRLDRSFIYSTVRGEKVNTYKTHVGVIAGNNINFGVNVTTMPGVIVGNDVTIGPSTVVMENIDDNNIFYTKFESVMKKTK